MADPEALDRLAEAAREGGRRAMNSLLTEIRPLVCRWALVWTGSPDLSEDVAQRVLVKVHRSMPRWRPNGRFTTWLYRITRNVVIDVTRQRARESEAQDRLRLDRLAQSIAPAEHSPEHVAEARILLGTMMRALTPRQRAAVDLVELQGFSPSEAAEMLDVAPATLRVHLHRARSILRELSTEEEVRR